MKSEDCGMIQLAMTSWNTADGEKVAIFSSEWEAISQVGGESGGSGH